MPNKLSIRHRRAGGAGAGAPPTAGAVAGEIALNFDVGTGTPEFWSFDGTNWQRINPAPAIAVTSKTIPGTATPAADGNAQAAGPGWPWVVPTGAVPIVTHNGVAYAFTGGPGSYGTTSGGTALTPAMFTSLGSATNFASQADVDAGTNTTDAINPATLRGTTLNAPSAAGTIVAADANRIVRLNANGKIDPGFLTISGLKFRGAAPVTAAPPTLTAPDAYASGDVYFVSADGASVAGWTGIAAGTQLGAGDALLFDGTNWNAIEGNLDPNSYLPLTGTSAGRTMTDAAVVTFAVPAGAAPPTPVVRIDGGDAAKSGIDNLNISGGTF